MYVQVHWEELYISDLWEDLWYPLVKYLRAVSGNNMSTCTFFTRESEFMTPRWHLHIRLRVFLRVSPNFRVLQFTKKNYSFKNNLIIKIPSQLHLFNVCKSFLNKVFLIDSPVTHTQSVNFRFKFLRKSLKFEIKNQKNTWRIFLFLTLG